MSEVAQAFAWIDSTMSADSALVAAATGGIWQGLADIGVTAPYAAYTLQSGMDTITMNAVRLFADIIVQIKAVGPSSQYPTLITIADRIDALFGRAGPVGFSSGGVLSCNREQTFTLDEVVNGTQWSHLGGLYRILLQGV